MSHDDHSVQIYADTQSFLDALEGFVSGGLRAGESVIVIATALHRRALDRMLRRRGYDLEQAERDNRYIPVDAETALDQFMVDGWPDESKFKSMVRGLLARGRTNGRQVRAFGEMVVLLWEQGDSASTIRLEYLWNKFCAEERFCLFCAYPRRGFGHDAHEDMQTICSHHTRVIPE